MRPEWCVAIRGSLLAAVLFVLSGTAGKTTRQHQQAKGCSLYPHRMTAPAWRWHWPPLLMLHLPLLHHALLVVCRNVRITIFIFDVYWQRAICSLHSGLLHCRVVHSGVQPVTTVAGTIRFIWRVSTAIASKWRTSDGFTHDIALFIVLCDR